MGGTLKFEDTLAARLNLMQPSESSIAQFLEAHPPQLSEGTPQTDDPSFSGLWWPNFRLKLPN